MRTVFEGDLRSDGLRIALVVARTNSFITERLLEGALDAVRRSSHGVPEVDVIRVPGAFELPAAAQKVMGQQRHDAVVCIGLVLRGATPHFEYISVCAMRGLTQVSLEAETRGIALTMALLTCNTLEQAIERAGAKAGNKGFEAAMAAIEMANLQKSLTAQPELKAAKVSRRKASKSKAR